MDEVVVLRCELVMIPIDLVHSCINFPPVHFDSFLCCQVFLHGLILISIHVGVALAKLAAHYVQSRSDVVFQVRLDEINLQEGLLEV